mgnify:CR=1 FL=1
MKLLKNKVSDLEYKGSYYRTSSDIVYLNGTYKPAWGENPYVTVIGKICIFHAVLANDAATYGLTLARIPSFAIPKDYIRCSAIGKNSNNENVMIHYDVKEDGSVVFYNDVNMAIRQMYINIVWEVK